MHILIGGAVIIKIGLHYTPGNLSADLGIRVKEWELVVLINWKRRDIILTRLNCLKLQVQVVMRWQVCWLIIVVEVFNKTWNSGEYVFVVLDRLSKWWSYDLQLVLWKDLWLQWMPFLGEGLYDCRLDGIALLAATKCARNSIAQGIKKVFDQTLFLIYKINKVSITFCVKYSKPS